jgi:hypothetical protein
MGDVFLGYPDEYQTYLLHTYGVPAYHPKHLKRLEDAGKRPKPTSFSPRRKGIARSKADEVGLGFLRAQETTA